MTLHVCKDTYEVQHAHSVIVDIPTALRCQTSLAVRTRLDSPAGAAIRERFQKEKL